MTVHTTAACHVEGVLRDRPLRPSTVRSYFDTLRQLDLSDVPMEDLSAGLIQQRLTAVTNGNTRRKHIVALRSMFREFDWIRQFKITRSIPHVYDLPEENLIRIALAASPHELPGLLMMYGGLRIGEACAVGPDVIRGDVLTVKRQRDDRRDIVAAKTEGFVFLPPWLADRVRQMPGMYPHAAPVVRESFRRYGRKIGICLTPHMLRHWYATYLVNSGVSPEIARQQLRHSDVAITLKYYAQIRPDDIRKAVGTLGSPQQPDHFPAGLRLVVSR